MVFATGDNTELKGQEDTILMGLHKNCNLRDLDTGMKINVKWIFGKWYLRL
jgi:hypothetical protein